MLCFSLVTPCSTKAKLLSRFWRCLCLLDYIFNLLLSPNFAKSCVPKEASILTHFAQLEDPRDPRGKEHLLLDIISIAICAVICGAESWTDIEEYGRAKVNWLKTFLVLPNGIPSHDTFARVFARLDPEQMQQCLLSWIAAVSRLTQGEIIPINGKFEQSGAKCRGHQSSDSDTLDD